MTAEELYKWIYRVTGETTTDRCTTRFRACSDTWYTCNRLLTDQCGFCVAFDRRRDKWAAVFNGYRDKPRVAVDGDL